MITPLKKTYKIPTSYTSGQMLEKMEISLGGGEPMPKKKWGKVVVKKKKEIGKGICLCGV